MLETTTKGEFMKNVMLAIVMLLVGNMSHAMKIDAYGFCSGSSCKVSVPRDLKQDQIMSVLVNHAEINDQLRAEIENKREEQAALIGSEAAQDLSDETLLVLILNKK